MTKLERIMPFLRFHTKFDSEWCKAGWCGKSLKEKDGAGWSAGAS